MSVDTPLQDKNRVSIIFISFIGVILFIVFTGLTMANYNFAIQNPGGNDFIPRWAGTRLLLTEGINPYSEEATLRIQEIIYGRAAHPHEDQVLFVYPLYVVLVIAPYALVADLPLARALWMTTLELAIIAMTIGSLRLTGWRPSLPALTGLLIFSALWYHTVRPLINGNPSIMVGFFILAGLLAMKSKRDVMAGFLLALATIKLHVVLLLLPFVMLWAYSQRRWYLFASLPASLFLLVAGASLFIPDWAWQNLQQVRAYPQYTLPGTPGAIFDLWWPGTGSVLGWLLTAVLTTVLLWEWRAAWGQNFRWFLWTACLTLVLTHLIGIRAATENYIALLPALILVWGVWEEKWDRTGRGLVLVTLSGLLIGLWVLFLSTIEGQTTQHPIMFFPLPIFLLVSLYFIRNEN